MNINELRIPIESGKIINKYQIINNQVTLREDFDELFNNKSSTDYNKLSSYLDICNAEFIRDDDKNSIGLNKYKVILEKGITLRTPNDCSCVSTKPKEEDYNLNRALKGKIEPHSFEKLINYVYPLIEELSNKELNGNEPHYVKNTELNTEDLKNLQYVLELDVDTKNRDFFLIPNLSLFWLLSLIDKIDKITYDEQLDIEVV